MEPVFFIVACAVLGLVSGFLGGLLGIGGGIVIVPVLVLLLDRAGVFTPTEATIVAVATSLATIVFTSASAAIAHVRANRVDWPIVWGWVVFLLVGSFLAGAIAPALPAGVFRGGIAVFLAVVAVVMLTDWRPDPSRQRPGPLGWGTIGVAAGTTAGLAGIGGGNVMVPTLVYFNTPIHRATAISSTLGVPIAAAGVAGYALLPTDLPERELMLGYVHLPTFGAIVVASVLAAPFGVRAAQRFSSAGLKRAFGVLLIFVALRMAYSATAL